jgi:hypothetical protein
MADAQNQPIQIVPDPQDRPAAAPAPAETPPSRGRRAAGVLGLALVGSLAGNGFQYVAGDALQNELTEVTQDRAAVTAERDALGVTLAETEQQLLESRGVIALVHLSLGTVRQEVAALEELMAPFAGIEPAAPEPVAAAPTATPSDRLAAVERTLPATPEATTASAEPAVAEPAPTLPAEVAPESGETIATRPTEQAWAATAEAEAGAVASDTTDAVEAASPADETITAAVSTSVDSASEGLAAAEGFVTETLADVPATLESESAVATEAVADSADAAVEVVEETAGTLAATSAEAVESLAAEAETAAAEATTPAEAEATQEAPAPVALPPSRGSFFQRSVDRVRSWF